MTVSGLSTGAGLYQQSGQQQSLRTSFRQLSQALQSGNLTAAQQAYGSIEQQLQNSGQLTQNGQDGDTLGQAMTQLGNALQSGNISGAQQALSSLQQQWQASGASSASGAQPAKGHGHGHHAHGSDSDSGDAAATDAATVSSTTEAGDADVPGINLTA